MNEICQISSTNKEMTYPFRFGTTNKLLHLTQHQLDRIPYLSNLIAHKDDFLSIENDNGEYVLSSNIRFNWFSVILRSITTEHPSVLFTELSQEANVLSMLKLYDYLCINPLAVPVLKDEHLVQSNSCNNENESKQVQYHRATRLEARDTAVLFIIALSRNEYNFDDFLTLERIFNLIMIILLHPTIFSPRLCHHTLVIVKEYCFTLFSRKQQCQLSNTQQYFQNNTRDSSTCLYDDKRSLPKNFQHSFAWKAVSVPVKQTDRDEIRWYRNRYIRDHTRLSMFSEVETRSRLCRYSEESSICSFPVIIIPQSFRLSNLVSSASCIFLFEFTII